MNYISNKFSINMISAEDFSLLRIKRVKLSDIPKDVIPVIGHSDTDVSVLDILGKDDKLFVSQYREPQLPEGSTKFPKGAYLEFFEVTLGPVNCSSCHSIDCNSCDMMN